MTDLARGDRVVVTSKRSKGTVTGIVCFGHSEAPTHREVMVVLDGERKPQPYMPAFVERLIEAPAPKPKLHLLPRVRAFLRLATVGGERVAG